ncbi:hypothetical protein PXK00_15570 [Phaeobacter sp. QD34_3]|uniref:hypothetical protein n=1 Tax=unclassified Phaeobacter TaxID=2621772 RepID=UPI00237F9CDE|nr:MULTISPECIES: hypothetical protein [unclassified Phaeobacter]MDE4134537.1 hypothetical protein [Phaeobacter sp. QD34_3]MDE4138196.1 hypothetical protein [Phaeobacter sp. QD34_24]MDE4174307.1 hypothetical protein [Phaeobacter sp. PT47_59]
MKAALISLVCTLGTALPALADSPRIEGATARQNGDSWTISVTLSHPDTGWDHYADGWRVLDDNGAELGLRVLAHPHVTEQPFTRSLSGIAIPDGITKVTIQARCNLDGWGDELFRLTLP